jgi:hypothetical protein
MPLVSVALEVGLVAGLWVLLFEINGWMFGAWATSDFANWIFLPAALRLVAVLICGWRGVLGLLIGALITNWLMQVPWPQAVALSILSATGPWVAVRLATDHLKLPTDLHGLRFSHLLLFAALGAGCNGLLHQTYLLLSQPAFDVSSQFVTMVGGDLIGTLLVMAMASFALKHWPKKL